MIGFELPLLRINSNYLLQRYRGWDVLSWLVKIWFAQRDFAAAQEKGQVPWDEPFMTHSVLTDGQELFPYVLSNPARVAIERLHRSGNIHDWAPTAAVGPTRDGIQRAIAILLTTPDSGPGR